MKDNGCSWGAGMEGHCLVVRIRSMCFASCKSLELNRDLGEIILLNSGRIGQMKKGQ